MGDLDHKQIVLGLSGGIAGYKSAELLRRLQDEGVTIDVVMTQSATESAGTAGQWHGRRLAHNPVSGPRTMPVAGCAGDES